MFASLHTHSDYSIFDGFAKVDDLVKRASDLGYRALGITDHGTVAGIPNFYHSCNKHGIKPILGCEMYLQPINGIDDRKNIAHIIILAKDNVGYKNMLKLNSLANQNMYYDPRITWDMLQKYHEGLIVTTACMGGLLIREDKVMWIDRLKALFKDDFYLEVHTNSLVEQKEYNLEVMRLSKKFLINVIPAIDVHYVWKEDADTHRKWKNLSKNTEYYTTDDYYLMDDVEIKQRLSYLGEHVVDKMFMTINDIVDKCNVKLEFGGQHYPNAGISSEDIVKECLKNNTLSDEYMERLDYEINVLEKADYINYFGIIYDICKYCDSVGILRGVGRGSVVASLVSYLLNITKLDPIKYGLIFERFVHLHRVTPPDIDLDFQANRRNEVMDYIKDKYGHVAQVRTVNYISNKAAIQRAGQALQIPPSNIDKISKSFTNWDDMPNSELKELAMKFLGHIQNFGCHASAVVVFPEEPENWCSIEKQKDKFVTSFDYHNEEYKSLEDMGILKLDILGLKTLDVIAECAESINLNIDNIPEDDKKTFEMLSSGFTKGVFQIESTGMTSCCIRMRPDKVEDIMALVALYRPGPLDAGMVDVFIKNRQGGNIQYLHPKLEPILKNTYGVIIYQEQIIQIVRDLCGYSLAEGDMVRRAIGRKEVEKVKEAVNEILVRGVANGIEAFIMSQICDQIVTFALYGFNMGHSAAYGYTSYITAYLKANYPMEFMCSLLNSELGDLEKTAEYVAECRLIKLKVLNPDIRHSTHKWSILDGQLLCGFGAIKGIGKTKVKNFSSFDWYIQSCYNVNKTVTENLIKAGAFGDDCVDYLLELLPLITNYKNRSVECFSKLKDPSKRVREDYWIKQLEMIEETKKNFPQPYKSINRYSMSVLGFTCGEDYLNMYSEEPIQKYGNVKLGEFIDIKPSTTRFGKKMLFLQVRTKNNQFKSVYFGDKEPSLYTPQYIKIDGDVVQDWMDAIERKC